MQFFEEYRERKKKTKQAALHEFSESQLQCAQITSAVLIKTFLFIYF